MIIASFEFEDSGKEKELTSVCAVTYVRGKKRKITPTSITNTSPAINRLMPNPDNIEKSPYQAAGEVAVSCRRASAASSVISRISAKDCKLGETNPAEKYINPTFSTPPSAFGA
jgi:hypothetical protein